MSFLGYLGIPVSGMTAQRLRLEVIGENIAKSDITRTEDGGPYRRQITLFGEDKTFKNFDVRKRVFGEVLNKTLEERREMKYKGVVVASVVRDEETPLIPVYDPTHPDADEDGYYYKPNVDVAEEELDAMAATQSFDNNYAVYQTMVSMTQRALSMGKN